MPICQFFQLARSHLPANQHQFLDHLKIGVGKWLLASCKLEYLAKWHVLCFLWYIFIFWCQKCWFIELNLPLGSGAVWYITYKIFYKMIETIRFCCRFGCMSPRLFQQFYRLIQIAVALKLSLVKKKIWTYNDVNI